MLLGLIAIVQAVFLPGYLAMRVGRYRSGSPVETLAVACALSLIINYVLVFTLVLAGAYGRTSALVILVLEGALVAGLAVAALRRSSRFALEFTVLKLRQAGWVKTAATVTALGALAAAALAAGAAMIGSRAFNAWDALVSWNEWAYSWYQGLLPQNVALYPQLIPANWSLMYHISGSPELQAFPLGTIPLLGFAILLMFLDLAIRRRRIEYLGALLLCLAGGLMPSSTTFAGYVDLPLAFMATACFYVIELRSDRRLANWRELLVPLVLACGASVIKLNGMYAVAVVMVLAAAGHVALAPETRRREIAKSGALTALLFASIPGAWYGLKLADFVAGRDAPNQESLNEAVNVAAGSTGLLGRLAHAVALMPGGWLTFAAIAGIVVLAAIVPRSRWVALGILAPYMVLWAAFLSYDLRNLVPVIPLVAYVAAFGVAGLLERRWHVEMGLQVRKLNWQIGRAAIVSAAVAALGVLLLVSSLYPTSKLVDTALASQREIGSPGLNEVLYKALLEDRRATGSVLTDYGHLPYLPGFRSDPIRLESTQDLQVTHLYQKVVTVESLENRDYLVLSNLVPAEVTGIIDERIRLGQYSVIAQHESGPFMEYQSPVVIRVIVTD